MIKKTIYILILLATVAAVVFAYLDKENTYSLLPLEQKSAPEQPIQVEMADSLNLETQPE